MPEAAATASVTDPNSQQTQTDTTASNSTAQSGLTDPNVSTDSQPTESWSKDWLKSDGSFDHKAFEKAPDELKPLAKDIGRYKSLDEFLKGFQAREALLGKKGLFEPLSKEATDAQKAERTEQIRKITGAPEKPEGYGLVKPEGLPDTQWDAELAKQASEIAFKHAASPELLKELSALQAASVQKAFQAQQQAEKQWFEGQDKLIREVAGKRGMDYDKAAGYAKRFGIRFGVSPDNPLFKNASFVLAAAECGKLLSESNLVTGDTSDFHLTTNMTPEAAAKESNAIKTDKNHPLYAAYWNRDNKSSPEEVKNARDRATRLSQLAYSNRAVRSTSR